MNLIWKGPGIYVRKRKSVANTLSLWSNKLELTQQTLKELSEQYVHEGYEFYILLAKPEAKTAISTIEVKAISDEVR